MATDFNSLSCVPNDVLQQRIFSDFNTHTLTRCSKVCKLWQKLASSDLFWLQAVPGISDYCKVAVKEFIEPRAVNSRAELIRRFKKFASETGLNQRNRFVCLFPRESDCYFVADLGCGAINISGMDLNDSNKMDADPDRLELCIFISMAHVDDPSLDNTKDTMSQIPYVGHMGPIPLMPGDDWSPLECYRGKKSNMICRTDLCLPLVDARVICDIIEDQFVNLKSRNNTLEVVSCIAATCFRTICTGGSVGLIGTGLNYAYSLL